MKTTDPTTAGESKRVDGPESGGSGWWCYGKCHRFVELKMDWEVNVCGRCHQATVAWKPGVAAGRTDVRLAGRKLTPAEVHAEFERLRESLK